MNDDVKKLVLAGNAELDSRSHRGWLLGHFLAPSDPRHSTDVEVKWAVHPKGDKRPEWVSAETRSALLILISGMFNVYLPERTIALRKQGDYALFHNVSHSWFAEEKSIVLALRWPSVPGFSNSLDQASREHAVQQNAETEEKDECTSG